MEPAYPISADIQLTNRADISDLKTLRRPGLNGQLNMRQLRMGDATEVKVAPPYHGYIEGTT